jgi:hypothetical protein
MAQMVELLLSKHKAVSSVLCFARGKSQQQNKKQTKKPQTKY